MLIFLEIVFSNLYVCTIYIGTINIISAKTPMMNPIGIEIIEIRKAAHKPFLLQNSVY